MMTNKMIFDRRRHKRYKTTKDTFVSFKSASLQLGHVINIGKGGIAFSYVDNQKPIIRSFSIDIFLANELFYLAGVPCKILSEFYLNGKFSNQTIRLRQCCVEFGTLTHHQSDTLDHFLNNHIIDSF